MTTELSDLLRRAAEPIAERDFVDGAFAGARARRRRNRWAALAATATVAAAAVAVTTIPGLSRDGATVPAGTPTVWSAAPFDLLGVKAIEGPAPLKMSQIPNTSDDLRTRWQLPSRLDFDASTPMAPLSSVEGNSAPVRAVMLRSTGEGQFQPVLYRPDLPTPFILVDSLTLTSNLDESGNAADPLAVRAISADRRRVAFVQRGKVLVLDAVTGETKPYPVPDNRLIDGGWVEGSETLLASSETHQWRINTTTGQVNSIAAGYAGPDRLVVTGDGTNVFRHYDAQGLPAGQRTAPRIFYTPWGETVSSSAGWTASAGTLNDDATIRARSRYQGVLAIRGDTMEDGALLLAANDEGVSKGCCQALAWGGPEQLLVRWSDDLIAWNVATGALTRVSNLPSTQRPGTGRPSGIVAIAP